MRTGFVTFVGRPNTGKSTLINRILGTKVSIVSDKPQTTRTQVRGVLTRPDAQIVFVDTPGIHKPRTTLGERLNASAENALGGVDVVCFVLDGARGVGSGDEFIASRLPKSTIVVLNKIDGAGPTRTMEQLAKAAGFEFAEYFPISARTGKGVDVLVERLVELMPEGPKYYPDDQVTDVPEAFWVAELVRDDEGAHRADGVGEERVRAVERINVAPAAGDLGPARGLHGPGAFEGEFVEIPFPGVGGNASLHHETEKISVGGNVVESMIMHADVGDVVGHAPAGAGTSELEEFFVAGGVVLQDGGAVNKPLGPLGPAAGGVFSRHGENRCGRTGFLGRINGKDFGCGRFPKFLQLGGEVRGLEGWVDCNHGNK